ncbi:hypothetical protein [Aeromonas salmonicida]|uniref:hypothetical protein n=1 Tax=Aeromonas salmonicida TaxID=645 RepID=UPI000C45CC6A|nr:hypothetical protein CHQ57_13055 [Aeromonas salmonicida]
MGTFSGLHDVPISELGFLFVGRFGAGKQIEKGELTHKQAQARYGIQGRSTILVWLRNDCYQNVLAERVNGILKGELLLQSLQDLAHQALKYRTPDAVHRGF